MAAMLLPDSAVRKRSPQWVLAIGLTVALSALTTAVAAGTWPVSVDHDVVKLLPASSPDGRAGFMLALAGAVTTIATPAASALTVLALSGWLSWRVRDLTAVRTVAAPLAALVASVVTGKAALARPGPPGSDTHGLLGYYPSGHTTAALVCGGLVARLISARYARAQRPLGVAAVTWTLLVGSSLVFHRYHWLSDVLAGLLLGALILAITRPNATADAHGPG